MNCLNRDFIEEEIINTTPSLKLALTLIAAAAFRPRPPQALAAAAWVASGSLAEVASQPPHA